MVKKIYLDTKINLLQCQGAELHNTVALDLVVGLGVHLIVLKPVPINSVGSKTYIWTPKSSLHNYRELSYTLKWTLPLLLALLLVLQVLKPDPINSAWSKTCIWIPRSTFMMPGSRAFPGNFWMGVKCSPPWGGVVRGGILGDGE